MVKSLLKPPKNPYRRAVAGTPLAATLRTAREQVHVRLVGGISVGFRLLTEADCADGAAGIPGAVAAQDLAGFALSALDQVQNDAALFVLSRCLVDTGSGERLFIDIDATRQAMTRAWKEALLAAYRDLEQAQATQGIEADIHALERIALALSAGHAPQDLQALPAPMLRLLVLRLAGQVTKLNAAMAPATPAAGAPGRIVH